MVSNGTHFFQLFIVYFYFVKRWKNIKVCLKDIEEGKYFRSPDDDPDHEYVWKVNIKTVVV